MTEYRYGQRWHLYRRRPIDEIDEATARTRFAEGPWFSVTAVDEGVDVPRFTLEVRPEGSFVRAITYRASGSIRTIHDYAKPDAQRPELFLTAALFYRYPDDEAIYDLDEYAAMVTYTWKPDGYASIRADDRRDPQVQLVEYRDVPVDDHWVPQPQFGDWERFATSPSGPPEGPAGDVGGGVTARG